VLCARIRKRGRLRCCRNYFQQSRLLRTKLPLRIRIFDGALKALAKKVIQRLDRFEVNLRNAAASIPGCISFMTFNSRFLFHARIMARMNYTKSLIIRFTVTRL